jgi:histidinol dehydrogenase
LTRNRWVAAKLLVANDPGRAAPICPLALLVLVIADEQANPAFVAATASAGRT